MPKCPKGCKTKYGDQFMSLKRDEQGLPTVYECPQCHHQQPLTQKEQVMEVIYGGDWYFGLTSEYCKVDEYYLEDEGEVFEKLAKIFGR